MNYNKIIDYIEDEDAKLINNPYYHAFQYKKEEFINMIMEGIKSPILLGKTGDGNNGNFYVSLSKNEECKNSIYNKLSNNPMFVINGNIKTVKARNFIKTDKYPISFTKSPLPFRECEYDDEYQRFLKVPPKYILAIQYNIFSNCYQSDDKEYVKQQLLVLKQMVQELDYHQIDLPIIDGSNSSKINNEKVLTLKL